MGVGPLLVPRSPENPKTAVFPSRRPHTFPSPHLVLQLDMEEARPGPTTPLGDPARTPSWELCHAWLALSHEEWRRVS